MGITLLPRNAVNLFNDPTLRFVHVRDLHLTRRLYLWSQPSGRFLR